MDFVTKVGDIVLLDNETAYQVLAQKEFNGQGYLFISKVHTDIENVFASEKDEFEIVQEVIDEDDEFFLATVEDKTVIEEIKKML